MKRIIIHWTAGTYFPTNYEKEHYHFLVDAKEKSITGYSSQKQMKYAKPANMQLTPAEETPVQSELLSAQC